MRSLFSAILCSAICLFTVGCSFLGQLDARGAKEPSFAFEPFWSRGPSIGPENPTTPGFDADGNKIPSPEVGATYSFPPVTTGMVIDLKEDKVLPTLGLKLVDMKAPYIRWFDLQAFGGYQEAGIYLGKRWTSIFEITTGPYVGYSFNHHDIVWGIGFTLSKF